MKINIIILDVLRNVLTKNLIIALVRLLRILKDLVWTILLFHGLSQICVDVSVSRNTTGVTNYGVFIFHASWMSHVDLHLCAHTFIRRRDIHFTCIIHARAYTKCANPIEQPPPDTHWIMRMPAIYFLLTMKKRKEGIFSLRENMNNLFLCCSSSFTNKKF